jgi:hypothetical protein
VEYHYIYRFYLFNIAELGVMPPSSIKVLRGLIRVEDIVRWGVFLGRHISQRTHSEGTQGESFRPLQMG